MRVILDLFVVFVIIDAVDESASFLNCPPCYPYCVLFSAVVYFVLDPCNIYGYIKYIFDAF